MINFRFLSTLKVSAICFFVCGFVYAADANNDEIKKYQDSLADIKSNAAAGNKSIDMLIKLIKKIEESNRKINELKGSNDPKLQELRASFANFNTQVEQLAIFTQALAKNIAILAEQARKQQNGIETYIVNNIGKPVTKDSGKAGLTIEAMIPDRVWLRTINGQKLTVKLDDNIPGYGKINLIDVENSIVRTDRGIKLKQYD